MCKASLIAVNYAARAAGVTRFEHVNSASQKCPNLVAVHTATYAMGETEAKYHLRPNKQTHKVSLDSYREASRKIHSVLQRYGNAYERAGVDEAYIDVTEAVHREAVGDVIWDTTLGNVLRKQGSDDSHNEKFFYIAAKLAKGMREAVKNELRYECSAGVGSNKALAKLASSLFKPNQQTILLDSGVQDFLRPLAVKKMRGFGGDLGKAVTTQLGVETVADLWNVSLDTIQESFDPPAALFIHRSAFGHYESEVSNRLTPKSVLAAKQIKPTTDVMPWIRILCAEVVARCEQMVTAYELYPKSLTLNLRWEGGTATRSCGIPNPFSVEVLTEAMQALVPTNVLPCYSVALHANGFAAKEKPQRDLTHYFAKKAKKGDADVIVIE